MKIKITIFHGFPLNVTQIKENWVPKKKHDYISPRTCKKKCLMLPSSSSLFSATSTSKSLIFMTKKAGFAIFGFPPNLERTVLRDYWADSDVRTCYGYLLDLYFTKKIFFQKIYIFFIDFLYFKIMDF